MPTITIRELKGRHKQIAVLVAEGCTDKEIAAALQIETGTVNAYMRTMFPRLGIHSRVHLARMVWEDAHKAEIAAMEEQRQRIRAADQVTLRVRLHQLRGKIGAEVRA